MRTAYYSGCPIRKLIDSASIKSGTDGAYWRLLKKGSWQRKNCVAIRCTLRGVFAVLGERWTRQMPVATGLFKVAVPQAFEKFSVFNHSKKCFLCSGDFRRKTGIFCAAVVNGKASWPSKNRTAVTKENVPGSARFAPQ